MAHRWKVSLTFKVVFGTGALVGTQFDGLWEGTDWSEVRTDLDDIFTLDQDNKTRKPNLEPISKAIVEKGILEHSKKQEMFQDVTVTAKCVTEFELD